MKIGILTGGGDVPGLNPTIKAVVNRAAEEGHEVVGIRRGWGGLLEFNQDDPESFERNIMPLSNRTVRTIDRTGGTFLHTSRTNPARVRHDAVPDFLRDPDHPEAEEADTRLRDFTPHVLTNLEYLGIDTLIPIGGDDTLSYGERLHSEGFPVVAIPKTMDNDVLRHRLLCRLQHGGYTQRQFHPSAPHQHGQPRAHRRGRALWA
jgi:ATP-dependent phosphofructokinase / diphosphate-dependent phosphofructokinase